MVIHRATGRANQCGVVAIASILGYGVNPKMRKTEIVARTLRETTGRQRITEVGIVEAARTLRVYGYRVRAIDVFGLGTRAGARAKGIRKTLDYYKMEDVEVRETDTAKPILSHHCGRIEHRGKCDRVHMIHCTMKGKQHWVTLDEYGYTADNGRYATRKPRPHQEQNYCYCEARVMTNLEIVKVL